MSITKVIPYDILINIFDWLEDDYPTLYHCSLANREFKGVSATYLYRKVTYSPAYTPILDLKLKRDALAEGFFASARLPYNSELVRRLEISGYLSHRPPPLSKFSAQLKTAIECWPNIQEVIFAPKHYHEAVFADSIPSLLKLHYLQHIDVNAAGTSEAQAVFLVQLRDLASLTIRSPSRAIMQLLPNWLAELRPTLRKFHLTDSCGSVTPGVLRSFLPHLQDATSFALGLSYSLTDDDVFNFWAGLPHLYSLEFRYYLQLRPSITPRIFHLRHLTVRYADVSTTEDAAHVYKWVRRVITYAPLESLRLVCEKEEHGAAPAFDSLLKHLCVKHASRLRILDMRDCFVASHALAMLCKSCMMLEELSVSISHHVLDHFPTYADNLWHLHTANFRIRNMRRPVWLTTAAAEGFMKRTRGLRRLSVDDARFEGKWVSNPDGSVVFAVERVENEHVLPWERGILDN